MGKQLKTKLATGFAERTGYKFSDSSLLLGALTHPSYSDHDADDYQRLEFLGDRVLGLTIADDLYRRFPKAREGGLARQYNYLVRKQTCAAAARAMGLGEMVLSQDIVRRSAKISSRILGDACEAVIAAIYLDSGYDVARSFVLEQWTPFLLEAETASRDAKSLLQEWSLGRGLGVPNYKVASRSGPDHEPVFVISVHVQDHDSETGEATSKRMAEQIAAQAFLNTNKISAK